MANTWHKKDIVVLSRSRPDAQYVVFSCPEGASVTAKRGWPVVVTSGYVVEAASPATAIFGFLAEDAHNDAVAGTHQISVIPALPDVLIEANFLAASAADNVLAAGDFGGKFRLVKSAGGMWYVEDTGTTTAVKIVNLVPETVSPTIHPPRAVAGDTNARVIASVLDAVCTWAS